MLQGSVNRLRGNTYPIYLSELSFAESEPALWPHPVVKRRVDVGTGDALESVGAGWRSRLRIHGTGGDSPPAVEPLQHRTNLGANDIVAIQRGAFWIGQIFYPALRAR
jgi:hypothetical protein